jgi:RNA 2',3'-cyclic 3'-phosphodiesterase
MVTLAASDIRSATTQRLYFALWPAPELQERLFQLGGALLGGRRGRRVAAENLHLTLAFLGSVAPERRACYESAADQLCAAPFTLAITHSGCFRRNGILWAGSAVAPPTLLELVGDLNRGLAACGFDPERRIFRAHLTLARNVRRCPDDATFDPIEWKVDSLALVASHAQSNGARYEVLRRWSLVREAADAT